MAAQKRDTRRVMLWAPPRSLSTAFERCISVLNETMSVEVTHEMYTAACHLGPNRQIKIPYFFEAVVYEPRLSYKRVKKRMEADRPGKDLVFCKELAYTVHGKFDMLPDGYRHTFLIRHPAKVFTSFQTFLEKFPNKFLNLSLRDILPQGLVYKEMFELMQHTTNTLGQKPIIIDADDLVENPEQVLRAYCEAIGVPYHPNMTRWHKASDDLKQWTYSKKLMFVNKVMGQYDRAFRTQELVQSTRTDVDVSCLPAKIRELTEIAVPFYQKMYECRLRHEPTRADSATTSDSSLDDTSSSTMSTTSSTSSSATSSASESLESLVEIRHRNSTAT